MRDTPFLGRYGLSLLVLGTPTWENRPGPKRFQRRAEAPFRDLNNWQVSGHMCVVISAVWLH